MVNRQLTPLCPLVYIADTHTPSFEIKIINVPIYCQFELSLKNIVIYFLPT